MNRVPRIRISQVNAQHPRADGDYVLYWMTAFRRTGWNFSLQRAVEWSTELRKPLIVLEALRCDYPWASDRLHQFVLEGMAANLKTLHGSPVCYYPFLEREKGQGKGLLPALAERACVVIADEYPCYFLPRMLDAAAGKIRVLMEKIDSNGLLPLRATDRVFKTAHSFRRFLQSVLPEHLEQLPEPDPLAGSSIPGIKDIPPTIAQKWPPVPAKALRGGERFLKEFPIDHSVSIAPFRGGHEAAETRLNHFVRSQLSQYHEKRNHPDEDGGSGLSPYLHFGHISTHQVISRVLDEEEWTPDRLGPKAQGQRSGWWGMSEGAESFLDELITWREIGFNHCFFREDYDMFQSLPEWAQTELMNHARDARPYLYSSEQLESAATHDALWNAAQTQLVREGRIHNYLRMLWGKKILQWTDTPEKALTLMIHLNNKYALDGRDPNSYTGILWVLGKYDRPWGPVRPVFGRIRYMSSRNTLKKLKVEEYLSRYRPES